MAKQKNETCFANIFPSILFVFLSCRNMKIWKRENMSFAHTLANPIWDLAHLLRIVPILTAYKIEKGQNNERFLVGLRISPTRVQLEDASKEENVQQSDSNHDGTMLQTEPDSHSFRVHDLEMASHCENMKYENIPQKYMLKNIKMSAKQYARH